MASFADQMAEQKALRATLHSEVAHEVKLSCIQIVLDRQIAYPREYPTSDYNMNVEAQFRRYLMAHRSGPIMEEYHTNHKAAFSAPLRSAR